MHNWGSDQGYGPMSGAWGGHEWWFAHLPVIAAVLAPIIIIVVLWSLLWKGLALWHAARRGQYWWFIILLLVNTMGVLEIIYLFFIAKLKVGELFDKHEHRG